MFDIIKKNNSIKWFFFALNFEKNDYIKLKHKTDGKINPYRRCIGCCFIVLSNLIKDLI